MKITIKHNLPFWLIIISFLFVLIIRDLFRDGMFMDGVLYTSVAKNLSNGLGSFWHPHFSQTTMFIFHEQPPLLFGIESIFFQLLGNSIYVERIYGLLILSVTIFLIHKLWECIFYKKQEKDISWLPTIFWLTIPVCFWSYSNNMIEPTMGVFDLASLLFIYKALIHKNKIYFYLTLAAIMLIAASMCKGAQGLFPLTAIFFYWVVTRNISFSKMLIFSFYLSILIIGFYGVILLNDNVRSSYEMYFNNRIVTTFSNPASTHTDRFYIIKQLFSELIPVLILISGMMIFKRIKKYSLIVHEDILQIVVLFFLIALSGSLPLMLTLEQSGFYLVTTFPYYAICFAAYFAPLCLKLLKQLDINSIVFKRWRIAVILFLTASIIISIYTIASIPKRDKEELNDIYAFGEIIPNGSIIGIHQEMSNDWRLHTYFIRYFYISIDASSTIHKYFLLDKTLDVKLVPDNYHEIDLPTKKYTLYIHNE